MTPLLALPDFPDWAYKFALAAIVILALWAWSILDPPPPPTDDDDLDHQGGDDTEGW